MEQATHSPLATGTGTTSGMPGEFLAFTVGSEEYGIDIVKVEEIRVFEPATRMANAPSFLLGLINRRGIIVPVVDMRVRFGIAQPSYDHFTVTIILNVGTHTIGMVVDSVSDVITLAPEQIRPAPEMTGTLDTQYLIGLGTLDERMLILADIDKLMLGPEMGFGGPYPGQAGSGTTLHRQERGTL